jgi:ABC-2 type transport system ATP-binding protein
MIDDQLRVVVEVSNVTRRFGRTVALDDVSLSLPRGVVFGLVGENGAGKTTLIKHVLGLLKAQTGRVRVLGFDPVRDPVPVLSRVGYLSEDRDLPEWLKVGELLRYLRPFYATWDDALAESLRRQFDLDPNAKIKTLSQGQRARAGLLAALAYRPEILVLDEPSTGLDPIVRREILAAIIRTIAEEGRTVLFSSHLLDEVERVCDHVALVDRGHVVLSQPLDAMKDSHRRLTLRFQQPLRAAPVLPGSLRFEGSGLEWTAVWSGSQSEEELHGQVASIGARIVEEHTPSLDEIFVARVGSRRPALTQSEV